MAGQCNWSALVVTCKTKTFADAIQNQLEAKQKRGFLPSDLVILCIEDPQDGIGSGGATLNALLTVTEHLSMKQGYTVVSSDVLKDARLLIMHTGRYFPFDPCCRGFVSLPLVPQNGGINDLVTNFDVLYSCLSSQLACDSPPGLWVCSCDMLITLPKNLVLNWKKLDVGNDVLGISVPVSSEYAARHGIYCLDEDLNVKDLIFQGTSSAIAKCSLPDSTVPLVSGIVFFSTFATERLLTTHVTPPLDACTYLGIDSGMEPVCISLYFDILLAMTLDVSKEDFVRGARSGCFGKSASPLQGTRKQFMQNSRSVLWKHLQSLRLKVVVIEGGTHCYLDMDVCPADYYTVLKDHCPFIPGYKFSARSHSFVHQEARVSEDAILVNCLVEAGARIGSHTFLAHCHIVRNAFVGNNCYIYGLDESSCLKIPEKRIDDDTFLIGMAVGFPGSLDSRVFACFPSTHKLLSSSLVLSKTKNDTRGEFFVNSDKQQHITSAISNSKTLPFGYRNVIGGQNRKEHFRTLLMAKIFPICHLKLTVNINNSMQLVKGDIDELEYNDWFDYLRSSLCEMLENVDAEVEFDYRQSLYFSIAYRQLHGILTNNLKVSLLPLFNLFVICGKHEMLLSLLDKISIQAVEHSLKEKRKPDVAARVFACIADVLGFMAGSKGGLRSGPSANKQWTMPLRLLESGQLKDGIIKLSEIRERWLHHPDLLIRAARHYEGAEQILIRHAVMSVSSFIKTVACPSLNGDAWYVAECPARIDLSGGWTDTPPICYEFGGSVVNAAILLNGKRPIGARIRNIASPVIILTLLGNNESETQRIECTTIQQLMDYNTPQAPGALLKACIVLSQIVSSQSTLSMEEQLLSRFQGGFELQTWSNLPRGSGLGTSSILAAAVMKVAYRASGLIMDLDSLIHSVLLVEQMLTTGGGWQDQVGGLVGGFKIGRSTNYLPLQVTVEFLVPSEEFYDKFSNHLKLIYTGKTRLAKNLLQNVLRNWYSKRPGILRNCKDLKENAEACFAAIENEDLDAIGKHVNSYWSQKKLMASGCEPELCKRMMKALSTYCRGQSLTGAGGGGFMYILTKEPLTEEFIYSVLEKVDGAQDAVVYDVSIDRVGMSCHTQSVS